MGEAGVARRILGEAREISLSGRNTSVAFTVRWLGAITVDGRFTEVTGAIRIPATGLEHASVEVDVGTASIRTGIWLRDFHLRGPTFLNATRFPLITFRAGDPTWEGTHLQLRGALTVRGVARRVELTCRLDEPAHGLGTCALLCAVGTTTLRRSDFAVGSPLGRLSRDPRFRLIGDEVRVTATLRASILHTP
jgi:polyisoprenoid-binding protein YceI